MSYEDTAFPSVSFIKFILNQAILPANIVPGENLIEYLPTSFFIAPSPTNILCNPDIKESVTITIKSQKKPVRIDTSPACE